MSAPRLCLSGEPTCTGLCPCEPCRQTIAGFVIPRAVIACEQAMVRAIRLEIVAHCATVPEIVTELEGYIASGGAHPDAARAFLESWADSFEGLRIRIREAMGQTPPPEPVTEPLASRSAPPPSSQVIVPTEISETELAGMASPTVSEKAARRPKKQPLGANGTVARGSTEPKPDTTSEKST